MAKMDTANTVRSLIEHEPKADPKTVNDATELIKNATFSLALSADVIGAMIMSTCAKVPTTAIDTMAVTIGGDGFPILMYNPEFTVRLNPHDVVFVLAHEAGHLLWRHLYSDPALQNDQVWTLSQEASLNHWVLRTLNRTSLPEIVNDAGKKEETGVNPRKVYQQYTRDLQKQGKEPVKFEEFITPDLVCYRELKRMSRPPRSNQTTCLHASRDTGGQSDGSGRPHIDQEEASVLVTGVLENAMHDAKVNGNRTIAKQLLGLEEQTEGSESAEKTWGTIGLGALRGERIETGKVTFWKQWIQNAMAERIKDGTSLRYLKKVWWDPRVAFRGNEYYRRVLVATDASGSMHTDVLNYIRALCGTEDDLETVYASWDATMWPVEGTDPFRGGGGTDVQCVIDYVEGRTPVEGLPDADGDDYDAVIVITDGHMTPRQPAVPDRWVFLITPNGNTWPEDLGMDCHMLPVDR